MKERKVHLPDIGKQKRPSLAVSKIVGAVDSGTSWARSLSQSQIADLIDLAGELAQIFPPMKNRQITQKVFDAKLEEIGELENGRAKLARVIGLGNGLLSLYLVWWSFSYCFNFTRISGLGVNEDEEDTINQKVAASMGVSESVLLSRVTRRDVGYLVNLFLQRSAQEMRGQVAWTVTQNAMAGNGHAINAYFKHIVGDGEEAAGRGTHFDPFAMTEGELEAEISKIKKQVGEEIHAKKRDLPEEAHDVEFDIRTTGD